MKVNSTDIMLKGMSVAVRWMWNRAIAMQLHTFLQDDPQEGCSCFATSRPGPLWTSKQCRWRSHRECTQAQLRGLPQVENGQNTSTVECLDS